MFFGHFIEHQGGVTPATQEQWNISSHDERALRQGVESGLMEVRRRASRLALLLRRAPRQPSSTSCAIGQLSHPAPPLSLVGLQLPSQTLRVGWGSGRAWHKGRVGGVGSPRRPWRNGQRRRGMAWGQGGGGDGEDCLDPIVRGRLPMEGAIGVWSS